MSSAATRSADTATALELYVAAAQAAQGNGGIDLGDLAGELVAARPALDCEAARALVERTHADVVDQAKNLGTEDMATAAAFYAAGGGHVIGQKVPGISFDAHFADALELEPPRLLVPHLVVENAVNWFSGHPKNLKTTIIAWAALERMREGSDVVWFDWEMGRRRLRRKFAELGAEPGLLRQRFHYVYRPVMTPSEAGFAAVETALAALGLQPFVVFDSAGKALRAAGLSEDSNTETLSWTTHIIIPTRDLGATVAVADHVTKSATRSTPYARGAGTKLADTEVHWYVEATTAPSRSRRGELLLTNQADRDGVLPERVRYSVGDGAGGLPIRELYAGDADETGDNGGDLRLMTAILETLDAKASPGAPITTSQLERLTPVKTRNGRIAAVAKLMAADADSRVENRAAGQSIVWWAQPLGEV